MSLLSRLSSLEPAETWPGLHNAAIERYWDGLDLATSQENRRLGAIYLLGYVAEIMLKVAFYRVAGYKPNQTVVREKITTWANWRGRNLHDIKGLALVLIDARRLVNRPFDPAFSGELMRHARILSENWGEALRYRHSAAGENELADVFQSIDWMLGNQVRLWS